MNSATKPLRILFVENSSEDLALMLRELHRGGYEPIFEQVMTEQAMRAALQKNSWDIILCDHSMPQFDSSEALRVYKETGFEIPFVIISGTMEESVPLKR